MKCVIKNEELKDLIIEAVDLICSSVSSTLGPTGNNVIINSDDLAPFISNDGVTIARSITSDNIKINTILEIIKEASLKTNDEVGDGTTTTLVLIESIVKEGLKEIDNGINRIVLKKELDNALEKIVSEIRNYKREANDKDLFNIASLSSVDKEIGLLCAEVFTKMKSKYAIKLEEGKDKTFYLVNKGYQVDADNIPSAYFDNKDKIAINNASVLVLRGYLSSLEVISDIINEGIERDKNIVIFVSDMLENIEEEIMLYNLKWGKNIYIFKISEYGFRKDIIIDDISVLTNRKVKNVDYENVTFSDLGNANSVIIRKNGVTIINDNENVRNRIDYLKTKIESASEYEREFLEDRISRLDKGIATIYVGGNSKTEIKEKLMRYEDALCALEVSKNGVVPGEGLTYLKVSNNLNDNNAGEKIMKYALQVPFQKVLENSGIDYRDIETRIKYSNYECIYNIKNSEFESVLDTEIIEPIDVDIKALINATSIASMLLTVNYMVINEELKNNKLEL